MPVNQPCARAGAVGARRYGTYGRFSQVSDWALLTDAGLLSGPFQGASPLLCLDLHVHIPSWVWLQEMQILHETA